MRDKNGLTIRDGDKVKVQTAGTSHPPTHDGTIIDADSHRAKSLNAVLVEFDNGTRQYMGGEHLAVAAKG